MSGGSAAYAASRPMGCISECSLSDVVVEDMYSLQPAPGIWKSRGAAKMEKVVDQMIFVSNLGIRVNRVQSWPVEPRHKADRPSQIVPDRVASQAAPEIAKIALPVSRIIRPECYFSSKLFVAARYQQEVGWFRLILSCISCNEAVRGTACPPNHYPSFQGLQRAGAFPTKRGRGMVQSRVAEYPV